jgi:hypothetical protein
MSWLADSYRGTSNFAYGIAALPAAMFVAEHFDLIPVIPSPRRAISQIGDASSYVDSINTAVPSLKEVQTLPGKLRSLDVEHLQTDPARLERAIQMYSPQRPVEQQAMRAELRDVSKDLQQAQAKYAGDARSLDVLCIGATLFFAVLGYHFRQRSKDVDMPAVAQRA